MSMIGEASRALPRPVQETHDSVSFVATCISNVEGKVALKWDPTIAKGAAVLPGSADQLTAAFGAFRARRSDPSRRVPE
jgi:hypothetical protein